MSSKIVNFLARNFENEKIKNIKKKIFQIVKLKKIYFRKIEKNKKREKNISEQREKNIVNAAKYNSATLGKCLRSKYKKFKTINLMTQTERRMTFTLSRSNPEAANFYSTCRQRSSEDVSDIL